MISRSFRRLPGCRDVDRRARRPIAFADRVGDRDREEHGGRDRDPGDQGEGRGGDREDRERRQSQRPGARDVPIASCKKKTWERRNSAGPPNVRIVKPSVV
jgi:hypothetical protein